MSAEDKLYYFPTSSPPEIAYIVTAGPVTLSPTAHRAVLGAYHGGTILCRPHVLASVARAAS